MQAVMVLNLILTFLLVLLYCLTWVGGKKVRDRSEQVIAENNEARRHIKRELATIQEMLETEIQEMLETENGSEHS